MFGKLFGRPSTGEITTTSVDISFGSENSKHSSNKKNREGNDHEDSSAFGYNQSSSNNNNNNSGKGAAEKKQFGATDEIQGNRCLPGPLKPPSAPTTKEVFSYNVHSSAIDTTVNFKNLFREFGTHLVALLSEEIRSGAAALQGTPSDLKDYVHNLDKTKSLFATILDEDFQKRTIEESVKFFRLLSQAPGEGDKTGGNSPRLLNRIEKCKDKLAEFIQSYFMGIPMLAVDPPKCRQVIYIWYGYIAMISEYLLSVIKTIRNKKPSMNNLVKFISDAEGLGNELDALKIEHRNRPILQYDFSHGPILAYINPALASKDGEKEDQRIPDEQYDDIIKILEETTMQDDASANKQLQTLQNKVQPPSNTNPQKRPQKQQQQQQQQQQRNPKMIGSKFSSGTLSIRTRCSNLMMILEEKAFKLKDSFSPGDRMNIFVSLRDPLKKSVSSVKCGEIKRFECSSGTVYNSPVMESLTIPLNYCHPSPPQICFSLASRHFEHSGNFFTLQVTVPIGGINQQIQRQHRKLCNSSSIKFLTERIPLGNKQCARCGAILNGNVFIVCRLPKGPISHNTLIEITDIGLLVVAHDCDGDGGGVLSKNSLGSSSSGLFEL